MIGVREKINRCYRLIKFTPDEWRGDRGKLWYYLRENVDYNNQHIDVVNEVRLKIEK